MVLTVEAHLVPAGLYGPLPPASKELTGLAKQLALPQIEGQCVHVHRVWAEDGETSYFERCLQDANSGWLCRHHEGEVFRPKRSSPSPYFDHVIGAIRVREGRALMNGHGRIKANGITYWTEASMTYDPEKYYRQAQVNGEV